MGGRRVAGRMRMRSRLQTPWFPVAGIGALVTIAVVAAIAFAIGPANQRVFVYSFAPGGSDGTPQAVAPLGLARGVPDALELILPCEAESGFRSQRVGEGQPDAIGGVRSALSFSDLGSELDVSVDSGAAIGRLGPASLFTVSISDRADCRVEITFARGVWNASTGSDSVQVEAPGPEFVEATFTGPAASSEVTFIVVETRELGSSPSALQLVWFVVTAGAVSLLIHELVSRSPRVPRAGSLIETVQAAIRPIDLAVLVVLVMWVVLLPPWFDDGWVIARQRAYEPLGAFSNLFDVRATVLPTGTWLEWLQRFWIGPVRAPVLLRLSPLLTGMGAWVLLRAAARRIGIPRRSGSEILMALVFVLGFGAWGMTLRPEPIIATLVMAPDATSCPRHQSPP